jgi:UrcA family protein
MNTNTAIRSVRGLACMGAAALITLGVFPEAYAGKLNVVTVTVPVKFADLDLNKPAGISELYNRIRRAADKACGDYPSGYGLWYQNNFRQCREKAVADAVNRINRGPLTALHQQAMDKGSRVG